MRSPPESPILPWGNNFQRSLPKFFGELWLALRQVCRRSDTLGTTIDSSEWMDLSIVESWDLSFSMATIAAITPYSCRWCIGIGTHERN